MIPDQARMLSNLKRSMRTAGYDQIVETWKLKRHLAAGELAEAQLAYMDMCDEYDNATNAEEAKAAAVKAEPLIIARNEKAAAYRVARESEIR